MANTSNWGASGVALASGGEARRLGTSNAASGSSASWAWAEPATSTTHKAKAWAHRERMLAFDPKTGVAQQGITSFFVIGALAPTVRRAMEDLNEVLAVWRGEVGRAIKSGRVLVLLILFLLFVGLALTIVGFINHQLTATVSNTLANNGADPAQATEALAKQKTQFLSFFFTDDEAMLDSLTQLPLVLLVVFKVTLRFVPLLIALMGFDQLAGDIGPKSIRFFVVRVKRDSLVLGKFLAQATIFALLLTVSTLLMVLVTKFIDQDFSMGDVAWWSLKLTVSSLVLALAYLGLTSLCSSLVKQGSVALVLNIILLFVVWFVALIGEYSRFPGEVAGNALAELRQESPLAYLRYTSVWHFGQDLLHPHWQRFVTAAIMHLGFALAFLGLSQFVIKQRDL